MRFKIFLIISFFLFLMGSFLSSAFAGLIGVKTIWITNDIWPAASLLQVSEVVATQTGTGDDVALLSASASAEAGFVYGPPASQDYAIDGVGPAGYPQIYHGAYPPQPNQWLKVTLAAPTELDSLTIYGRTDCCSEHDIYDVQLLASSGEVFMSLNGLDASGPSHSVSAQVPIPSAAWLLGSCLVGLIGIRRKLKK